MKYTHHFLITATTLLTLTILLYLANTNQFTTDIATKLLIGSISCLILAILATPKHNTQH